VKPKANFEIRAVEAFRAPTEAAASYESPSADGKRRGVFYVNTTISRHGRHTRWEAFTCTRRAWASPAGRRRTGADRAATVSSLRLDTAYGEAGRYMPESLAHDLGLYTDPYNAFGTLQQMWRAVRLSWTRASTRRAGRATRRSSTSARTRRSARPTSRRRWIATSRAGQALAYKVGQLEILRLRRLAQQKLGVRFDIRAFHSQVLESGSLPLPVLEAKINRWIK